MSTRSAVEILGRQQDSMRAVWDNATNRDRAFICKAALVANQAQETEYQTVLTRVHTLRWDELNQSQKICIREACRRIAAWARDIGIVAAFEKKAA